MQNTWAVQNALGQIVYTGSYIACIDYMYAFVAEYTIKKYYENILCEIAIL